MAWLDKFGYSISQRLFPSAGGSAPQGNNEPSHAISSLGSMGATPRGGGGIAVAATTAAASHSGAAVKKESTAPSVPSKVTNTTKNQAPQRADRDRRPGSTSTMPFQPLNSCLPWYTVTAGYEVGVFQGWDQVAPLVLGASGAVYQHQPSRAYARAHFATARSRGDVWVIARPEEDNEDDEDSHYYED
ncbi:hypothetical protein EDD18DRAFT_1108314 [Armillaria luteobubalina]|uniref:Ribonuclease H1 N-terminal domain-containing protein n=1 Tax=Armillaria luteobubalina TaxID=153913 RepID=A0AA39PZ38_9AGAR|nr:hypothetical protein EDD18DRAFT_1108314 [Armillaria luteobubalina]